MLHNIGGERNADERRVVIEAFQTVMERQDQKEGQRPDDDHQKEPSAGMFLAGVGIGIPGRTQKIQSVTDDVDDVFPVDDHDGDNGAQMEQHVKKHVPLLGGLHMKNVLQHRQMTGAGDGQELRHALDKAKEDGSQNGQGPHSSRRITYIWQSKCNVGIY